MKVLNEESEAEVAKPECYRVSGRHFTLHPVQLPPWLPECIIHQMIYRFEVYVSKAIGMIQAIRTISTTITKAHHSPSDSMDSNSAYSDSSDGSKGKVLPNARPRRLSSSAAAKLYRFPLKT